MSLKRLTIDRVQIPWELLSLAKDHMRNQWEDDDRIIVHKLTHAIDLFEKLTQFRVFLSTWEWLPGQLPAAPPPDLPVGAVASLIPVCRVSTWSAKDGDGGDITASFALWGDSDPDSIAAQYLTAASNGIEPTVALTAGYAAAAEMSPMITDIVLRVATYLCEFREVQNVPGIDGVAYCNSLLSNWWIPRC